MKRTSEVYTKKYGKIQAMVCGIKSEDNVLVGYIRKDNKHIRVHYINTGDNLVWVSTWDYPGNSFIQSTEHNITAIREKGLNLFSEAQNSPKNDEIEKTLSLVENYTKMLDGQEFLSLTYEGCVLFKGGALWQNGKVIKDQFSFNDLKALFAELYQSY